MNLFRRASAAVLALVASTIAVQTHACECYALDPMSFPLERFTLIASGSVQSIEGVAVTSEARTTPVKLVTFAVERTWKGRAATVQQVYTGLGGPDCGFPFEVGKQYLLAAEPGKVFYGVHLGSDALFASRFGLTTASEKATKLIERLDRHFGASPTTPPVE